MRIKYKTQPISWLDKFKKEELNIWIEEGDMRRVIAVLGDKYKLSLHSRDYPEHCAIALNEVREIHILVVFLKDMVGSLE